MKCTAIVLAAGQGKRMKSKVKKQFLLLDEKPVLCHALECFQNSIWITDIILVTGEESIDYCQKEIVEKYQYDKVKHVICGGKERYNSVYEGLKVCEGSDYVFIHDGARPFVEEEILNRAMESVKTHGACVVGMPSKDTVKIVDKDCWVCTTPQRSLVWSVQTPQVFRYEWIREAYDKLQKEDKDGVTDDAMVLERFGDHRVKMVEGSYENIKITTPEDLSIAESILKNRVK